MSGKFVQVSYCTDARVYLVEKQSYFHFHCIENYNDVQYNTSEYCSLYRYGILKRIMSNDV